MRPLLIGVRHICHPFYTVTQKIMDTAGRVDRFRQKYNLKAKDSAKSENRTKGSRKLKIDLIISSVQSAILSLRENGFIWQASRGSYALEDEGFAEWFRHAHVN